MGSDRRKVGHVSASQVKTERVFMRLSKDISWCTKAGKELLLFCARGFFYGLGISFFMILRLGPPATHELSSYMVGLFVTAGLKFGFSLWVIRSLVPALIHHFRHSNSPSPAPRL